MHGMHDYGTHLVWEGNTGEGTARYAGYDRAYRVLIPGKPALAGSADPAFRGDAARHNPEDLFLAAISSCHMLSYLALCARQGVNVLAYEDDATGRMATDASGGGRFVEVVLHPRVTITTADDLAAAQALHATAHAHCFIANSCSVEIRHEATVSVA
jgi:organic hydroperoxide reductase OsmC/OhrA